jgi:hypothetical protein
MSSTPVYPEPPKIAAEIIASLLSALPTLLKVFVFKPKAGGISQKKFVFMPFKRLKSKNHDFLPYPPFKGVCF